MNRTCKAAVAALIFAVGFAGSAAAGPLEDAGFADDKATDAYQKGDYATALRLLRPLAEQGKWMAQGILGDMYSEGHGVPQDCPAAVSWWRKAAAQGDGIAKTNLRKMRDKGINAYEKGHYAMALQLWRPLAEQGDAAAQYNFGLMYDNGQGVLQDYEAAAGWWRKAAEQGHIYAQYNLGLKYLLGLGVPQDYAAAAGWFRRAADQGDADAQIQIGYAYFLGDGAPEDYVLAHMWFNLAAARGGEDAAVRDIAAKARTDVAAKMTPAQIAEAQKLAREWKPKSSP